MQNSNVVSKSVDNSVWAARYTSAFGLHLIAVQEKIPVERAWGEKGIFSPGEARRYWAENPDMGIGVVLGPSAVMSLDIDHNVYFSMIMEEFGLPEEELEPYPTIVGNPKGRRIMFRVPKGADIPHCTLTWPNRNDPTGQKYRNLCRRMDEAKKSGDKELYARLKNIRERYKEITVFEIRAATDGRQRYDVLPPSDHPIGKRYEWVVPPDAEAGLPEPLPWIITVAQNWSDFKTQFLVTCPWLPKPTSEERKVPSRTKGAKAQEDSVIFKYCKAHPVVESLEKYGYEKKGRRYLSPHSSSGIPGVWLPDGEDSVKVYIHHASDPLAGSNRGSKPVNSFDLYCEYEHGGDVRAAVRAAAKELGLDYKSKPNAVAKMVSDTVESIDRGVSRPQTGQGAGLAAGSTRSLQEMLATAQSFDTQTPPEEISTLLRESVGMSAMVQRKIMEVIKEATRMPFSAMRDELKAPSVRIDVAQLV